MADLGLGGDIECWQGVPWAPGGWRPRDRPLQDTREALLDAWARREARAVAGRRADLGHVADGVDRWATRRLLESEELAPDAAGALRAVLTGNVVTETVAAKWGAPGSLPPLRRRPRGLGAPDVAVPAVGAPAEGRTHRRRRHRS